MTLQPSERAQLRQFLSDRFNLNELKNLAYDLGADFEKLSHEEKETLSRELIAFFEHRNKLDLLVTEVLKQRPEDFLVQLKAKLPSSDKPLKKIQIIVTSDLLDDVSELLDEFTAALNCTQDDVVLIGAAWGSTRLLVGLSEQLAASLINLQIHNLLEGKYQVVSLTDFDSLDKISQRTWHYVAFNHPPIRKGNLLRPTVSWKDALEKTTEALSPINIPSERLRLDVMNRQKALSLIRQFLDERTFKVSLSEIDDTFFSVLKEEIDRYQAEGNQILSQRLIKLESRIRQATAVSPPTPQRHKGSPQTLDKNPIFRMGMDVLNKRIELLSARKLLVQPHMLTQISSTTIEQIYHYTIQLFNDLRRGEEAYILTELNYLAARTTTKNPTLLAQCTWALMQGLSRLQTPTLASRRISLGQEAKGYLIPGQNDALMAQIDISLGDAYLTKQTGDLVENIQKAIQQYKHALKYFTQAKFPLKFGELHIGLGNCYLSMPTENRQTWVEEAVKAFQTAVTIFKSQGTEGKMGVAAAYIGLGSSYRAMPINRVQHLKLALDTYNKALLIYTITDTLLQYAMVKSNIGSVYLAMYSGDRSANLEKAILAFHDALTVYALTPHAHLVGMVQHNLGLAFAELGIRHHPNAFQKSIHAYQSALKVRTVDALPRAYALTQVGLGKAHFESIFYQEKNRHTTSLQEAITAFNNALKVYTRDAFPDEYIMTQNNLGRAYLALAAANDAQANDWIQKAISVFEDIQQHFKADAQPYEYIIVQRNLGNAYARLASQGNGKGMETAVSAYTSAIQTASTHTMPFEVRQTSFLLGNLYFDHQEWQDALTFYQKTIEVDQTLLTETYTESGRFVEVSEAAQLYARAAYCLLSLEKPDPATAFTLLEQGKTRLIAETFALSDVDLSLLPESSQNEISNARQRLRQIETERQLESQQVGLPGRIAKGEQLKIARHQLTQLVKKTRDAHPDFMPYHNQEIDIQSLIPENSVVVAPLITDHGSAAFILSPQTETISMDNVLWLHEFNATDLKALLIGSPDFPGWMRRYGAYLQERDKALKVIKQSDRHSVNDSQLQKANRRLQNAKNDWQQTIQQFSNKLWPNLMGPIFDHLQGSDLPEQANVTFLPQGGLGLLPLHIAWTGQDGQTQSIIDNFTLSYAPSALLLQNSRKRLHNLSQSALSLFSVEDPTYDLQFSFIEAALVNHTFPTYARRRKLSGDIATTDAVLRESRDYSHLHFSCHGRYDWREVVKSGLKLANGRSFTLAEIISKLNLKQPRIATLSACETGITEFQQYPDEYIGLPNGFLQAGVPGIVSTLWAVDDLSSALLMWWFYDYHINQRLSPAIALRKAQVDLRDLTLGELKQQIDNLLINDLIYFVLLTQQYNALTKKHEGKLEKRPFSHPYYWAAFIMTGV